MEKTLNFQLHPSKQQYGLDTLLLLLTFLLLFPLLSWPWLLLYFLVAALWLGLLHHRGKTTKSLSYAMGQWWLVEQEKRTPMAWRTGSVRRAQLILWRYGRWPWQQLLIRPDSLAAGQYQQLLRAMASHAL